MPGPTSAREAAMLDAEHDVAGRYLGLLTAAPTNDVGTGHTELAIDTYARVPIAADDWDPAIPGDPATKAGPKAGRTWAFPYAANDWTPGATQIIAWAIFDAPTGGNIVHWDYYTVAFDITQHQIHRHTSTSQIVMQGGDPDDPF